ncbi:hypothetical protein [Streptomyces violascens]|uniref:Secreted protein n=1 Tax=Streptomyces violascens TaxID=67381 RepID=A0ABQ3QS36_9ACTN|nr:hypothetical protein [Streptomyces violascens]GHI40050.1 hypothetical protein Sviol_44580 [Streptomyces violascens]
MSDAPGRRRPLKKSTTIVLVALLLIAWTALAGQWSDKGCRLVPDSCSLVIGHGAPDRIEGCESELGGPQHTDNYGG